MVSYELAHELAAAVVYAKELDFLFLDLWRSHFSPEQGSNKEDLRKYLEEWFEANSITVPIHSPIVERYEASVTEMETAIAPYQSDYPGLYRVLNSIATAFSRILGIRKRMVRDEKMIWTRIISEVVLDDKPLIDSIERLRQRVANALTQLGIVQGVETDSKDIPDLITLLMIVTDAYLAKTDKELVALARRERKLSLVPLSETQKYTQDLREAEKALAFILPREQALRYREAVVRIENRVPRP